MAPDKQAIRMRVWKAMEEARVGRFPLPLTGGFPIFRGLNRRPTASRSWKPTKRRER